MNINDTKKLQELCTNLEINEKVLSNWRSELGLMITISCLGNSTYLTKPGNCKCTCDDEFRQDLERALEAQIQRIKNQIATM